MAKMDIRGTEELAMALSKLASNTNDIAQKMVKAGANPVADKIRKNLEANIRDPAPVGRGVGDVFDVKQNYGKASGDLQKAMGISPVGVDSKGNTNVKIGFAGYDSKGVPNALKARAMESGTSKLEKRPFIRPALKATEDKALKEMVKTFEEQIKIYSL